MASGAYLAQQVRGPCATRLDEEIRVNAPIAPILGCKERKFKFFASLRRETRLNEVIQVC